MSNKLILLRHGESEWNFENRFTGWTDVNLTDKGKKEAKEAGNFLNTNKINIDIVYSSYLKRAIDTAKICINQLEKENIEVYHDWRLNERHYGDLQGLNKTETSKRFGEEQVRVWRRSYDIAPPSMSKDDKRHPIHDKLYTKIDPKELPNGESLKDTILRVNPFWLRKITPLIKKKKDVLIVAHGNSIRGIVKMLKNISDTDIIKLNIPTGMPYVFELSSEFKIFNDYYINQRTK